MSTLADLAVMAVDALRLGAPAVENQGLGDHFRALSPTGAANPLAFMIEHLDQDPEGSSVQNIDGVLPVGDLRDRIREVVTSAPLEILREAWQVVDRIQAWAEEFTGAVEAELAAGQAGQAVLAWCLAALMPARTFLVSALKPSRRTAEVGPL